MSLAAIHKVPFIRLGHVAVAHRCRLAVRTSAGQSSDFLQSPLKSIKLICTDVDGTLLNSNNEMLESTKKAIRRASEAGIPVCCLDCLTAACAMRASALHSPAPAECLSMHSLARLPSALAFLR